MYSSDILNDTTSIEGIAAHYFNVISACESTKLKMGILCSLIKTKKISQLLSLPCSTSLPGQRASYDNPEISTAIAAFSEEHANKEPALFTKAFLRHEGWHIAFLMI